MQLTDANLTGFIDGELTRKQMADVRSALARDPQAAARFEALQTATNGLQQEAKALLDIAPPIPAFAAGVTSRKSYLGLLGIAGVACAVAAAVLVMQPAKRDWMDEVASYQALYVTETLAGVGQQSPEVLTAISNRIGEDLTPATNLNGLTYRRAQLLGVEGQDLVQMAYLDANGTPFALCLIKQSDGVTPLTVKPREGLSSAAWADGEHAYLLIGGHDLSVVETLAKALQTAL